MACNVFGAPITDETLKQMAAYQSKVITRKDKADVAMERKNDFEAKDVNVKQYVENLKKKYGNELLVGTLCLVYNATGDHVTFDVAHDYMGYIGQAPYPLIIANGQWGGFFHVKKPGDSDGSKAALVYRGKNNANAGDAYDRLLAWCTTPNLNQAYAEIREGGYYRDPSVWRVVSDSMAQSGGIVNTGNYGGCFTIASTGSGTNPVFEAILTLK